MSHEYIGLKHPIRNYGKKTLLYCEMELLTILKRYDNYKNLRRQELALKSLLKTSILELKEAIRKLNRNLPTLKADEFSFVEISKEKKKRNELQEEIAEVKRKIAELTE